MNNRKVYYSFNEIPFEGGYSNSYNNRSGLKFSRTEIFQIIISVSVLTIAFSFALAPNPPLFHLSSVLFNVPIAFLAIVTAFLFHEIAHKYMGQKYGYWSEFRMFPMGLLLALFLGLVTGFVFAAPGAVQIFGNPTGEETGKISAAGPLMNITISSIFFVLMLVSTGILSQLFYLTAYINAFLAFFNLLPFGPLDGRKILYWRKEVWGTLLFFSISILILISLG